jgi:hypothetical protein
LIVRLDRSFSEPVADERATARLSLPDRGVRAHQVGSSKIQLEAAIPASTIEEVAGYGGLMMMLDRWRWNSVERA